MSKLEHIHVKLSFKQKGNLQMKDERFLLINLKLHIPKQRDHISNSQSMSSSSEKHLSFLVSNLMIRHDKSVERSFKLIAITGYLKNHVIIAAINTQSMIVYQGKRLALVKGRTCSECVSVQMKGYQNMLI